MRAARLAESGVRTVGDFLITLPFRYEDRRRHATVATLVPGQTATVLVRLTGVRSVRMRRGTLRIEAAADDGTGAVRVVWHNRYPSFVAAVEKGRTAFLYGTPVVTRRGELQVENPETEFFEPGEDADPLHSGRIVGVYHRLAGVAPRIWRTLVRRALDTLSTHFDTAAASAIQMHRALEAVHFPDSL
ncbi:MAG TPA: hypothetical protein VLO07_01285, partial [Thermoanaerobaculia bacterium]|nr:hypothetical protein [Thermoanaerobaculia bacterium]